MSKLLDDIKRAGEARRKLEQSQPPDRIHSRFNEEKPGKSALRGQAEADPTQQGLVWLRAVLAARELSTREATRTRRARWLLAAAAFSAAVALGIGVGRLLETISEPAAVPIMQPAAQMRRGPPLELRLETDFEQFGRRVSASTPGASNLKGVK